MENNIVLIYPMCISKNLQIICFWELNKKGSKRRLTVNLEISRQVTLRVSAEASVGCLHCVDADTDFNNCSCQEEWIGFSWPHPRASASILFGVWKKSKTEEKGKWISLGSWVLQFRAKVEETWYGFVTHLLPLLNSPWSTGRFACIPDMEKLHANRTLGPTVSYQCRPRRDAQVKLLQIKEILGRMFGKIIVPIFHLDTFASKITASTVSYFISSLRQPGISDISIFPSVVLSRIRYLITGAGWKISAAKTIMLGQLLARTGSRCGLQSAVTSPTQLQQSAFNVSEFHLKILIYDR